MNHLFDTRTECYSLMSTMTIGDYISLIKDAHASKGGIKGQRDALKTTSAKRIRDRMVSDIRRGAVLPPVVLGAVVTQERFHDLSARIDSAKISEVMSEDELEQASIIDGMQRTTALMEAVDIDIEVARRSMRVEFWIAQKVDNLIYRMLVLNTGQVPWTLSRQLSVVYSPLLADIQKNVHGLGRIFTPDDPGRRIQSGEFGAEAIVELYIAFSLRKTSVDTKEALSDEFSRLDFVDNLSDAHFQELFYETLSAMVALDKSFSRFDSGKKSKFSKGRNIFDSQPARIGLIVALGQYIIGRPAMEREHDVKLQRIKEMTRQVRELCHKLDSLQVEEVGHFLKLDVLSEVLDKRVGQVGRYERSVFFEAFSVLIQEDFSVPSMEPCWRAN
ncbi:hypothetical protein [Falsirhodobacter sp. 20TX0035]|uniref:hypothetical protein n=1 Tax=Falsirhodobacter sp. 20TX0035 TaxID=3022019 RepID=UPI00232F84A7|nr:hypothetical protein [Falsirhodobacter sp. 20TX0035]MDB6454465.1 hypothetical protein [Falsirhodobacter sp. 20TX0035]